MAVRNVKRRGTFRSDATSTAGADPGVEPPCTRVGTRLLANAGLEATSASGKCKACRNSLNSSSADVKRSVMSGLSARLNQASTDFGSDGRSSLGEVNSPARTFKQTAVGVGPANGHTPVSISKMTTESAHRSARWSTLSAFTICSGLM